MMKKTIIAVFTVSLMLMACGPSNQALYDFNTKLVGVNNSLQGQMLSLNNVVDNVLKSRDFSSISFVLGNTKSDLSRYETEVEKYPAPAGGEKFKTAVSDYIKVLKEITGVYTELSGLPKNASEEDINKIITKADNLYKIEETKLKAAQLEQEEFAKANKLNLK